MLRLAFREPRTPLRSVCVAEISDATPRIFPSLYPYRIKLARMGMLILTFYEGGLPMNKHPFLFCGFTGWCLEILWTGLHSLLRGDAAMKGTTSLLMFPIYGCAALIIPAYRRIKNLPIFLRGCLYTAGFYFGEFTSGSILQASHMCPWDYSGAPHQYRGIIRLDYLPVWFLTGLFFEKILTKSS